MLRKEIKYNPITFEADTQIPKHVVESITNGKGFNQERKYLILKRGQGQLLQFNPEKKPSMVQKIMKQKPQPQILQDPSLKKFDYQTKVYPEHIPSNLNRLFNKGKEAYGIRFEENEVMAEMRKDKKLARLLKRNKRIGSSGNRGPNNSKMGSTSHLSQSRNWGIRKRKRRG